MAPSVETALLVDTCSVYKLYFFTGKVIPPTEILVPNMGKLEFHQIVKKEFEDDVDAYHLYNSLDLK